MNTRRYLLTASKRFSLPFRNINAKVSNMAAPRFFSSSSTIDDNKKIYLEIMHHRATKLDIIDKLETQKNEFTKKIAIMEKELIALKVEERDINDQIKKVGLISCNQLKELFADVFSKLDANIKVLSLNYDAQYDILALTLVTNQHRQMRDFFYQHQIVDLKLYSNESVAFTNAGCEIQINFSAPGYDREETLKKVMASLLNISEQELETAPAPTPKF